MHKHTPPSITETAFNCPHCGALTTQYWHEVFPSEIRGERKVPFILTDTHKQNIAKSTNFEAQEKARFLDLCDRHISGLVSFESVNSVHPDYKVLNLHLSKCYNCKKISVWVHDKLLFPAYKTVVHPNPDLPDEILRDFEEAREVVDKSPRGAAAILRLCIQKLCAELGEKGKNIDDDIASLVRKGLNPLIQKSLDIVRVIGNEAVHPGTLDLKDDRDTAIRLFEIVNSICEQTITHPRCVETLYSKLPQKKLDAIAKRDSKQ